MLYLFDISFKKCQTIYINAKNEEDHIKLSHANIENHNKQQEELEIEQQQQEAAVKTSVNNKLVEEKFYSVNYENQSIKG